MNPLLKKASGERQPSALSCIAPTQGLVLGLKLFNVFSSEGEDWIDRQQPKDMGDAKLRSSMCPGHPPDLIHSLTPIFAMNCRIIAL